MTDSYANPPFVWTDDLKARIAETNRRLARLQAARERHADAMWMGEASPDGAAAQAVLDAFHNWETGIIDDHPTSRMLILAQLLTDTRAEFGRVIGYDYHGADDVAVALDAARVLGCTLRPLLP